MQNMKNNKKRNNFGIRMRMKFWMKKLIILKDNKISFKILYLLIS